jgi:hypothetical protein
MYIWIHGNVTRNPLYSYLKQTKLSFVFPFTSENRRAEYVLPVGGWYLQKEEGWERAWEGEYSANTVYTCMGVDSSMIYLIYFKNFCKCHYVSPSSTTIKINKLNKAV